jgi:hypothetical protein
MIGIVVFGLLISGVTVWPAILEVKLLLNLIWGDAPASSEIHRFGLDVLAALEHMKAETPFMFYAHDWLAFAHIVLAILFAGIIKDPVRNIWVIQCGLIMCALIPVLAGICIPLRGLPPAWFWIDSAFAPGAAIPLWIAFCDVRKHERASTHPASQPPSPA